MRILLGNKFWHPKGGVETYLRELIEELPSRGYEPIPFAMRHPRNWESPFSEFFVGEVDYSQRGSWLENAKKARRILHSAEAAANLSALIERHRPDLAHLHNIYHQLSPSILPVLKRHGIPVLMTLHDLKLACPNYKMRTHGEICERCVPGKYHHAIWRRCVKDSLLASAVCAAEAWLHRSSKIYLNNVDRFIVPSRFYGDKMIAAGIPPEKLVCIPNFTHLDRYQPSYEASDYFVFFGRLSEEKGLRTLLTAMRGLDQGRLLVLGDGPLASTLESVVSSEGLENVELVGPKYGEELRAIVRGARFSVIPSEWYENCPLSCIESFASGTPVIAADIGGLPEMIDDGNNGLLFRPFSASDLQAKIAALFEDGHRAVRMGERARATAERYYGVEGHLSKLLPLYTETLNETRMAS